MTHIETLPKRRKIAFKRNKPRKPPKPQSLTKQKKLADSVVSKYVRTLYADKDGIIQCYTCPFKGPINKMQCGHLVSRYYLATRYDLRNLRPQCITCNVWRNGRIPEFAAKLQTELGTGIVEELYATARQLTKNFDYQNIINTYTPLIPKDTVKKII